MKEENLALEAQEIKKYNYVKNIFYINFVIYYNKNIKILHFKKN